MIYIYGMRSLVFDLPDYVFTRSIKRKNHFLGIGIDNYASNQIENLYNAAKDIEDLSKEFNKLFFIEQNEIIKNKEATRIAILQKIKEYTELTENDNLIICFSGHGHIPEDSKEGFWVPHDGIANDEYSLVSNEEVIKLIKKIRAHHILLVVDACFSASLFQQTRSSGKKYDNLPSRFAISSGALEKVPDGIPGENSPFVKHFIKCLREHLGDYLSIVELSEEVKKGKFDQTPVARPLDLGDNHWGDFLLYKRESPEERDKRAFEYAKEKNQELYYYKYLRATSEGVVLGDYEKEVLAIVSKAKGIKLKQLNDNLDYGYDLNSIDREIATLYLNEFIEDTEDLVSYVILIGDSDCYLEGFVDKWLFQKQNDYKVHFSIVEKEGQRYRGIQPFRLGEMTQKKITNRIKEGCNQSRNLFADLFVALVVIPPDFISDEPNSNLINRFKREIPEWDLLESRTVVFLHFEANPHEFEYLEVELDNVLPNAICLKDWELIEKKHIVHWLKNKRLKPKSEEKYIQEWLTEETPKLKMRHFKDFVIEFLDDFHRY